MPMRPPGARARSRVREERRPELGPDGLDHLDADDRVVAALDLAVVAQLHVDPARHAGPRRTLTRQRGLLVGEREGGDRGATARGPHRQRAPAGADLEQVRPEADAGGVEQLVDLASLGELQGVAGGEARARVRHRLVQEEREEVVREVVVTLDVAPGTGPGVLLPGGRPVHVEPPQALHPRGDQARHARREGRQHRRGVVGVPVAGHERLTEADQAVGAEPPEERVAAHTHQGGVGPPATDDPAVGETHAQHQARDHAQEEAAGDGRVHRPVPGRRRELLPRARGPRLPIGERQCFRHPSPHTPSCTGAGGRGTTGSRRNHNRMPCSRINVVTRWPARG